MQLSFVWACSHNLFAESIAIVNNFKLEAKHSFQYAVGIKPKSAILYKTSYYPCANPSMADILNDYSSRSIFHNGAIQIA